MRPPREPRHLAAIATHLRVASSHLRDDVLQNDHDGRSLGHHGVPRAAMSTFCNVRQRNFIQIAPTGPGSQLYWCRPDAEHAGRVYDRCMPVSTRLIGATCCAILAISPTAPTKENSALGRFECSTGRRISPVSWRKPRPRASGSRLSLGPDRDHQKRSNEGTADGSNDNVTRNEIVRNQSAQAESGDCTDGDPKPAAHALLAA